MKQQPQVEVHKIPRGTDIYQVDVSIAFQGLSAHKRRVFVKVPQQATEEERAALVKVATLAWVQSMMEEKRLNYKIVPLGIVHDLEETSG